MHVTTSAIVLHTIRYGEADLIVKLFTKSSGLRSYLLRGVLKSRRGKIKASLFQPLTLLDIEANHKNKGALEHIREARLQHPYRTLHTEVVKSSLVLFLSEILKNAIQEEEENQLLYSYIETSLLWLDSHNNSTNFHLIFMLKLTQYLGFYPDDSNMAFEYFDMLDGCFYSQNSGPNCISGAGVSILRELLGTTFETCSTIKMSKNIRSEMLSMLLTYFELHLQGFRKPKSLEVLNQIFN